MTKTHLMSKTPTYQSWNSMIRRCTDVKRTNYRHYGGRGIKVCQRWLDSFENFLADMGVRPPDTSLDRRENDGNYEPGNCKWSTRKEQSNNRRKRARTKTVCSKGHQLPPIDQPYERCARCHADETKARRDAKRIAEAA